MVRFPSNPSEFFPWIVTGAERGVLIPALYGHCTVEFLFEEGNA